MPYNTNPMPPRREASGQVQLPLSRIKKLISLDGDVNMCSNNAAFVITLATELFIQHLAEQGHHVVKSERKPRRNIQYRDLSNAVAHQDNLEFLVDVVPRTVPYKQIREKKKAPKSAPNGEASGGQTTLDGAQANGTAAHGDEAEDEAAADPNAQLEMDIRRADTAGESDGQNGRGDSQDVEMS